jgi:hypothetical protein
MTIFEKRGKPAAEAAGFPLHCFETAGGLGRWGHLI